MSWILLALVAHVVNAVVFIIDKGILSSDSPISQPLRLTFYTGLLSGAAIILLPFQFALPNAFIVSWSVVSAGSFLGALWFFFSALKIGEPSRVVPLIGSLVPVFTLIFATTILGEQLVFRDLIAVLFLIAGGALLSITLKGAKGLSGRTVLYIVFGGAAFAVHFSAAKYIYSGFEPFLAAFAYSRFMGLILSLGILGPLMLWSASPKKKKQRSQKRTVSAKPVIVAFFASKVLSTGAFILQNYAIDLGSVTVVNALQGTQYVFVLLLAMIISIRFPKLFREELHRVALVQKVSGIVLVSFGLVLLL